MPIVPETRYTSSTLRDDRKKRVRSAFRERRPVYGPVHEGVVWLMTYSIPLPFYADASRCRSIEFYLNTPVYAYTRVRQRARARLFVRLCTYVDEKGGWEAGIVASR